MCDLVPFGELTSDERAQFLHGVPDSSENSDDTHGVLLPFTRRSLQSWRMWPRVPRLADGDIARAIAVASFVGYTAGWIQECVARIDELEQASDLITSLSDPDRLGALRDIPDQLKESVLFSSQTLVAAYEVRCNPDTAFWRLAM